MKLISQYLATYLTTLTTYITAFVLLLSSLSIITVSQAAESSELLAIDTVTNYLNAVSSGDIQQIKSYLAPDLLKERQPMLDNPSYSNLLQNTYSTATFNVLGSQTDSSGKIWVDVKISLNLNDSIQSRFLLSEINTKYLIISER